MQQNIYYFHGIDTYIAKLLVYCYSWRPQDMPQCISGFHPKMEWLSRKKRSAENYHELSRMPKRAKRELRRRQKKLEKLGRSL